MSASRSTPRTTVPTTTPIGDSPSRGRITSSAAHGPSGRPTPTPHAIRPASRAAFSADRVGGDPTADPGIAFNDEIIDVGGDMTASNGSAHGPALFDVLSPLVTGVMGAATGNAGDDADDDPFQALIADIAIHKSREVTTGHGDGQRHALLRAVAELAETHAVAADLACEKAPIDLPLDIPDLVGPSDDPVAGSEASMLIVPDMIRTVRDRLAVHATAADRTKLDIVAGLFDRILADDRLATGIRNTLARLQLPVLRIALADETFFNSRTHPTRRLLDRLTASAAEWQDDRASSRKARASLERVVHTVIRGSFEDAGEHARLLEQFERAIVDLATAASAAPVVAPTDPEDRDVLVIKATIQISQLLAGVEVDREIRFFLLDVWSRVLVEIACLDADPQRDALLARAKRLCFDLAWTTAPKTTSGDRARLAGLLPTMIAAVRDGLRVIDYPRADEERFFGEWTRVLAKAVGGGADPRFRTVKAGGSAVGGAAGIDAFALFLREGSFGPDVDLPADGAPRFELGLRTADDVTPSMLRQGASSSPAAVPGAVDASPAMPAAAPKQAPIVIADLRKGEWFDLRDARGTSRVRLSWVSPLRSFYLFIGTDSALTRSFDPAALAGLVECGDLTRAAG